MTWLSIVLWLITNAPALIGVVSEILKLIHLLPPSQQNAMKTVIASSMHRGRVQEVMVAVEGVLAKLRMDIQNVVQPHPFPVAADVHKAFDDVIHQPSVPGID